MRNLWSILAVAAICIPVLGCGDGGADPLLACQLEIMIEGNPAEMCVEVLCAGSEANCAAQASGQSCDDMLAGLQSEGVTATASTVSSCSGTMCHYTSSTSPDNTTTLTVDYYSGNQLGDILCQSIADAE